MSVEDVTTDRFAAARAAKAAKRDPYAEIKAAQQRTFKNIDAQIAKAAAKGTWVNDDKEAPFDPNPDEIPEGHVRVRVRKRGAGKISMGVTLTTSKDRFPYFREGDIFVLPAELAITYGEGPNGDDGRDWVEPV